MGFQRHLCHERHLHVLAHFGCTASNWWENLTFTFAIWANEPAHIFDDSQNWSLSFFAEIDFFADIAQGDLLRCCHDDGTEQVGLFQILNNGDVLVTCTRRSIDDEVVEVFPKHIGQKLLDDTVLSRASPDNGVILVGKHKPDRHDRKVIFDVNWTPSFIALVDLLLFKTQHSGNRRSTNIDIKQSDVDVFI